MYLLESFYNSNILEKFDYATHFHSSNKAKFFSSAGFPIGG